MVSIYPCPSLIILCHTCLIAASQASHSTHPLLGFFYFFCLKHSAPLPFVVLLIELFLILQISVLRKLHDFQSHSTLVRLKKIFPMLLSFLAACLFLLCSTLIFVIIFTSSLLSCYLLPHQIEKFISSESMYIYPNIHNNNVADTPLGDPLPPSPRLTFLYNPFVS